MVTSYLQLLERRYKEASTMTPPNSLSSPLTAMRMRALIDGLLTYSRIGTHGKAFRPTSQCSRGLAVADLQTPSASALRYNRGKLPTSWPTARNSSSCSRT
jgi:light-regulated signal transduction histidine kinase (bacteriophytochrome)